MMETMLRVMDVVLAVNMNTVVMDTKTEMVLMIFDEILMTNNAMMATLKVMMDVAILVFWKINVAINISIRTVKMIKFELMMMNIAMSDRIVMMHELSHVLLISSVETCDILQALPVSHVI